MIVHVQAYLGQDVETLKKEEGQTYYKLSAAEKTGKEESPLWMTVFCPQLPTTLLPHLTKGSFVSIVGRLSVNLYKGKPNLVINSLDVQLLFSKKEEVEQVES